MLTNECCLVVGLVIVRIRYSVWLVSGYAHVFVRCNCTVPQRGKSQRETVVFLIPGVQTLFRCRQSNTSYSRLPSSSRFRRYRPASQLALSMPDYRRIFVIVYSGHFLALLSHQRRLLRKRSQLSLSKSDFIGVTCI